MTTVRIIKDWSTPNLFRQTHASKGMWGDIKFFEEDLPSDYVIVLNTPLQKTSVFCPRENIWLLLQEPPNEVVGWLHNRGKQYRRVYTTDPSKTGTRITHSHPALPWHVDKDYDFLIQAKPSVKDKPLSWITSSKNLFAGHRDRMAFLDKLRNNKRIDFDLFGHGFAPIHNKWDGLATYCYSLAIENHRNPYYWTEKISDCFLAWTMPIYYGCTHITEYFPKEAMICVDIHDPTAPRIIEEVIQSNQWKKNIDAIEFARNKVLNEYQFFPFITNEISRYQQKSAPAPARRSTLFPARKPVNRVENLKNWLSKYPIYRQLKQIYKSFQLNTKSG